LQCSGLLTLGAGDVFHGALTHAVAGRPVIDDDSFGTALRFAARVAAYSCQTFGTRAWTESWPGVINDGEDASLAPKVAPVASPGRCCLRHVP
jgi:hypothetical protein